MTNFVVIIVPANGLTPNQSGAKPKLVAKILATNFGNHLCMGFQNWYGVGGAVRFLVVGTIGQGERPPRGQLWMEQCLTSLKYWPIQYTIWADPNYTWGLASLADSLLFSVNNILAGLWINCISSVEITLFLLADILLQHRALFQC